jgi:ATP adenylyltransferase
MRNYLFNTEKIKYIRNKKKEDGACILCAIKDKDPDFSALEVFRSKHVIVTVNLYPYTSGHVMVFPKRHCETLTELTEEEALDLHRVTVKTLRIIEEAYQPHGFNIGYNLGSGSGASIRHIHQHIVPRYTNELGFIDVLAGDRIIVVDPCEVLSTLKEKFPAHTDL